MTLLSLSGCQSFKSIKQQINIRLKRKSQYNNHNWRFILPMSLVGVGQQSSVTLGNHELRYYVFLLLLRNSRENIKLTPQWQSSRCHIQISHSSCLLFKNSSMHILTQFHLNSITPIHWDSVAIIMRDHWESLTFPRVQCSHSLHWSRARPSLRPAIIFLGVRPADKA